MTTTLHPGIERLIVLIAEEQVTRALREAQKGTPSDATNVEGVEEQRDVPEHSYMRDNRVQGK